MKIKKIFTLWLATELRDRGFYILKVEPNTKKPWLKVYIFEETPQLLAALSEITAKRGK